MTERLLRGDEAAKRLAISVRTLQRHMPRLRTMGLKVVGWGVTKRGQRPVMRIVESSLDKIIKKAA